MSFGIIYLIIAGSIPSLLLFLLPLPPPANSRYYLFVWKIPEMIVEVDVP